MTIMTQLLLLLIRIIRLTPYKNTLKLSMIFLKRINDLRSSLTFVRRDRKRGRGSGFYRGSFLSALRPPSFLTGVG